MDSSPLTPKFRNRRRKFISPGTSSPYQSPLIHMPKKNVESAAKNLTLDELKASTLELWEKNKELEGKIAELENKGFKEEQLQWYIEKLHKYNEIKDIAQTVMGKIAILDEVSLKEVHEEFGMTEND